MENDRADDADLTGACVPVCLCACVPVCLCLTVSLSDCLSGCLSNCLSNCLSDCLSDYLSDCVTVLPCHCDSLCLSWPHLNLTGAEINDDQLSSIRTHFEELEKRAAHEETSLAMKITACASAITKTNVFETAALSLIIANGITQVEFVWAGEERRGAEQRG